MHRHLLLEPKPYPEVTGWPGAVDTDGRPWLVVVLLLLPLQDDAGQGPVAKEAGGRWIEHFKDSRHSRQG